MKKTWNKASLAKTIDHTRLKTITTVERVVEACQEARVNHFASVCINPCWVSLAAKELAGSDVAVCTVVGFPLGATPAEIKVAETQLAITQGAREIDMVINVGALKSGDSQTVENEIKAVVAASGSRALVKVIIETCFLTDDEKRLACQLCVKAGAHFVKTATGFGTGGATVEDIKLMRETVGQKCKIKASGGIRSYDDALAMLEAGADRLGTSSGVAIMADAQE